MLGSRWFALGASLAVHGAFATLVARHAPRPNIAASLHSAREVSIELAEPAPANPAPSSQTEAQPTEPQATRPVRRAEPSARAAVDSPVETTPASAPVEPLAAPAAAPTFALSLPAHSVRSELSSGGTGARAEAGAENALPVSESVPDVRAKLLVGAPPAYTALALQAGVEADVPLEIVVDRTGTVRSAHPSSRVGYGLDEAAIAAVRSYRFSPAFVAGKAVAVRMRWLVRFQLR